MLLSNTSVFTFNQDSQRHTPSSGLCPEQQPRQVQRARRRQQPETDVNEDPARPQRQGQMLKTDNHHPNLHPVT